MEDADPHNMSLKSPLSSNGKEGMPGAGGFYVEAKVAVKGGISPIRSDVSEDESENASNTSNSDNDQDHGECDYEDDDGLFEALKHIPVKVELEEGDVREGASASEAATAQEGIASTSGNEADGNFLKVKKETKSPPKKKRKRRRLRRSYFSDEEKLARRKIYARERARKYRNNLTEEQLETLKEKVRERARQRRQQMTEEESILTRMRNREQAQMRRLYKEQIKVKEVPVLDNNEERKAMLIREKNRERMRMKRSCMTEEQKIIERQKNRERVRRKREMQKAEALLHRLMNVHGDMIDKQDANSDHFLQTMIKREGEDNDQKLTAMKYDEELVQDADVDEQSAQKQL